MQWHKAIGLYSKTKQEGIFFFEIGEEIYGPSSNVVHIYCLKHTCHAYVIKKLIYTLCKCKCKTSHSHPCKWKCKSILRHVNCVSVSVNDL